MSIESQRPRRFIGGSFLLMMASFPLTMISAQAFEIAWPIGLGIFVAYLLIQAVLMSWLMGSLFEQHEMRQFRIGIGAMLIMTTMIALPMGAISVYDQLAVPKMVISAEQAPVSDSSSNAANNFEITMILSLFAGIMYFALIPLLLVLEAVLAWYLAFRNRRPVENVRE